MHIRKVVQEIVLPLVTDEMELMDKLNTYGTPQCLTGAVDLLLQQPALAEKTCPPRLLPMQVQAHVDAWFRAKEMPKVARSTTGSRPGTSLADVMFGMLYAKTLTTVQKRMRDQGVLLDFSDFERAGIIHDAGGPMCVSGTTYADDSGFFTHRRHTG